jgi:hypothetical protein
MNKLWVVISSVITAFIALLGAFTIGIRHGKKDIEAEELKKSTENGLKIKKDIDELCNLQSDTIDDILRKDSRSD